MQVVDFIQTRLAFAGFPWGELRLTLDEIAQGRSWQSAFLTRARLWRRLAISASGNNNTITAMQFWRWAACAYHAASFFFHLQDRHQGWQLRISRLRGAARACYLRSLTFCAHTKPLSLDCKPLKIQAYFRKPQNITGGAVVLVNGLDSVAEVELHTFGNWMLERGLAILAVDLPAGLRQQPRCNGTSLITLNGLARTIADWLITHAGTSAIGAFGVSFGGNLVARLLAGDPRFVAGVAVSPPAFFGPDELALERLRKMLAWSFGLNDRDIEQAAPSLALSHLAAPSSKMLLCQMESDQLFGAQHASRFKAWGGAMVDIKEFPGEHVGTSKFHLWLPIVCDWLKEQLISAR